VRARAQVTGPSTSVAMRATASVWAGDEMGKPASMTSTFRSANLWAMRTFSETVIEAPGACSPSRRVVSKIVMESLIGWIVC
jgi:hypothetical protein